VTAPGAVTMTQNGTAFAGFTVSETNAGGRSIITIKPTAAQWLANATYTITFTTAIKDSAGVPIPAPVTFTLTMGA
jgi:hypothetical protein